jgi:hypothetical protein
MGTWDRKPKRGLPFPSTSAPPIPRRTPSRSSMPSMPIPIYPSLSDQIRPNPTKSDRKKTGPKVGLGRTLTWQSRPKLGLSRARPEGILQKRSQTKKCTSCFDVAYYDFISIIRLLTALRRVATNPNVGACSARIVFSRPVFAPIEKHNVVRGNQFLL